MSLDYYLYCRHEYDNIIEILDEIIEKCELISDISTLEQESDREYYEISRPEETKNFFIERQNHIKRVKKLCDKKILELCKHDFVEDLIDISPERSKLIRYCRICECTEH